MLETFTRRKDKTEQYSYAGVVLFEIEYNENVVKMGVKRKEVESSEVQCMRNLIKLLLENVRE